MRLPPRQDSPCPGHIIDYVEAKASCGGKRARVASVNEVKSAQQQVFILSVCFDETDHCSGEEEVHVEPSNAKSRHISSQIQTAISKGNSKIVARVWKGSARWWNLNTNDASGMRGGMVNIARSEIAGYRMARAAMSASHASAKTILPENDAVIIPEVIYFSCDYRYDKANKVETIEHRQKQEGENPWAILSYVGDESCYFQSGNNCHSSNCSSPWKYDGQYARDMVKIRHEFGFDEPHPRWGRVKEDQALNYAMRVLTSVVLPIQSAFFPSVYENNTSNSLVEYEGDLAAMGSRSDTFSLKPKPAQFLDMVGIYREAAMKMTETTKVSDSIEQRMGKLLATLDVCIEKLNNEATACAYLRGSEALPATLCHMDLQPQNLILRRQQGEQYDVNVVPYVSSVLDWEEACYADPRFEVLLMARKVCANRDQADKLWEHYSHELKERYNLVVGPIVPWLKLEAVHSITTLLLQSMDLVGGGRNPWESKPDLLGKIEREFARLEALGWDISL